MINNLIEMFYTRIGALPILLMALLSRAQYPLIYGLTDTDNPGDVLAAGFDIDASQNALLCGRVSAATQPLNTGPTPDRAFIQMLDSSGTIYLFTHSIGTSVWYMRSQHLSTYNEA